MAMALVCTIPSVWGQGSDLDQGSRSHRERDGADRPAEEEHHRHAQVPDGFRVETRDGYDPTDNLPRTIVHEKTGYRLKLIPAGEFRLGSPEGVGLANERPQRIIHLDAYWIGETPVTCEQFVMFLNDRGNQEEGGVTWVIMGEAIKIQRTGNTYRAKPDLGDHPGVDVSWYGARAFARWLGGQLPTEAQWEKAAKGGRDARWPWGDTWDRSKANTMERLTGEAELKTYQEWKQWWDRHYREVIRRTATEDWSDTTTPVRRYQANSYGLYDMAGNVWEWCEDWYVENRYSQLRDGQRNPPSPASEDMQEEEYWQDGERKTERDALRVARGGGWVNTASHARCASRFSGRPKYRSSAVGLRVVVSPMP